MPHSLSLPTLPFLPQLSVCAWVCVRGLEVCIQHVSLLVPHPPQTGMPGMKRDCGGAAGILGAFLVALKMVSDCS